MHGGNDIGQPSQSYTIHANICCQPGPSIVVWSRPPAKSQVLFIVMARLTLCLPVASAGNLGKQFGP